MRTSINHFFANSIPAKREGNYAETMFRRHCKDRKITFANSVKEWEGLFVAYLSGEKIIAPEIKSEKPQPIQEKESSPRKKSEPTGE